LDTLARLRFGIAGKGLVGQLHPRNAVQSDEVDVIAMAGARDTASGVQATRDLVASSGTPRVRTVEELLAEVEPVLLARRTSEHAQQTVSALGRSAVYPGTNPDSAHVTLEFDNAAAGIHATCEQERPRLEHPAASGALRRYGRWTVPQAAGSRAAPSRR
jgi:hypothetical protein